MADNQESQDIKKKDVPFEEALHIVGDGRYTWYISFVSGLTTLGAMSMMQAMYFVLPSVACEMRLNSVERAFLASLTFLGSIISSNFWGIIVDKYGRRRILLMTTLGASLVSVVASVSPNPITLKISTFFTGVMCGGIFGHPYVYLSEFCNKRIRSKYITNACIIAILCNTYSPSMAWMASSTNIHLHIGDILTFSPWRLYLLLNAVPTLLCCLMLSRLPESPKYLLVNGKATQALRVLADSYKRNHRQSVTPFPVKSLRLDLEDEVEEKKGSPHSENAVGLLQNLRSLFSGITSLFRPPFLLYTAISALMMIASIGLYGVVLLWMPEEISRLLAQSDVGGGEVTLCQVMSVSNSAAASADGGNNRSVAVGSLLGPYSSDHHHLLVVPPPVLPCHMDSLSFLTSILVGLTTGLATLLVVFLIRVIRVRTLLGVAMLIGGVSCLATAYSNSVSLTLVSIAAMMAVMGASTPMVFSLMVEFFPTSHRATATMVSLTFGRLTVLFGSTLLGAAFKSYCEPAYVGIAVSLGVIGLVCFLIPSKREEKVTNFFVGAGVSPDIRRQHLNLPPNSSAHPSNIRATIISGLSRHAHIK